MADRVTEPTREIEVHERVDVLVVGGGPSGLSAAVAAARAGARVSLVEHHGFLGGMWTAGMVLTLAGFNSWLRPYPRCVTGIPGEWVARAEEQGGALMNEGFVINTEPEVMKRVADDLVAEAGISCLFHTWGATPIVENDQVKGAFIENVDGRRAILADVTIDCTGNGDMLARSGGAWVKGNTLQPMTMSFRLTGARPDPNVPHDVPATLPIGPEPGPLVEPVLSAYSSVRRDLQWDRQAMRAARGRGELPSYGGPWFGGLDKDIVWVNSTRIVGDASDACELSRAEVQGRRESKVLAEYLSTHVSGLDDTKMIQTSTQIGVRETRRIVGRYTMTGDDVRSSQPFDDSIAVGCWPIDVHPSNQETGVHQMYVPRPYDIPYRILVPETVGGLITAGRCVSVDREALGSIRVGATCGAMGQAAGVAAAIAAANQQAPADVDIASLQQSLVEQGATVSATQVWAQADSISSGSPTGLA